MSAIIHADYEQHFLLDNDLENHTLSLTQAIASSFHTIQKQINPRQLLSQLVQIYCHKSTASFCGEVPLPGVTSDTRLYLCENKHLL